MTEQEYVDACEAALRRAGCRASERPPAAEGGVWVVMGCDAEQLPFACGRPEGRAASWWQACRMNGVTPPPKGG